MIQTGGSNEYRLRETRIHGESLASRTLSKREEREQAPRRTADKDREADKHDTILARRTHHTTVVSDSIESILFSLGVRKVAVSAPTKPYVLSLISLTFQVDPI